MARGYWFFEATTPVLLADWDGRIIAEHNISAEGEWMTEAFVPFTATAAASPCTPFGNVVPSYSQRSSLET